MSITYPPTGATIGWYVYKQKLENVIHTGTSIGSIPCYSQITPLVGTLYASRDAARRAARKLTDTQRRKDRNSPWSYDFSAAKESDRHLFKTVPKALVGNNR